MTQTSEIHTIILDAGPIIRNEPSVSTLLARAQQLVTIPAIIDEVRDQATRTRLETTLRPFLRIRTPQPASVKFIQDFSRKTGDLAVLSRNDIAVLALAYEIECERNQGDWRLRNTPGQRKLNGKPPEQPSSGSAQDVVEEPDRNTPDKDNDVVAAQTVPVENDNTDTRGPQQDPDRPNDIASSNMTSDPVGEAASLLSNTSITSEATKEAAGDEGEHKENDLSEDPDSGSDSEGWITPSNLGKKQAEDESAVLSQKKESRNMQVATLTTDFAMQNVLLQINLNLISSSLSRVHHLRTYILRCHACFEKVKDMNKQFCPRCGKPTLSRVTCSTNTKSEFKIHLKKNMEWNKRGDRYNIPKPVPGSSSGKVNVGGGGRGGGKGGWGQSLILAEDQKEYIKAVNRQKWHRERDLMDEDYLPSILSGERKHQEGRPKIGAGRTVNARKRH